ncbi:MFS transporter [Streptomyces longispororuber]|uniref:MFS transporter n=1 Tax=Streptomyces longispororuber TaxID=68230 RepID=UPI00210A8A3C|nr:MFS transporter [Streptomyces longispororuber]MCQ4205588.1 MFS transporter [Streptomyces longispororuber]
MYLAAGRSGPSSTAPAALEPPARRTRVASTVVALGAVSLVTDISSEMVTAVLPLYFVLQLGLNPLQFGFLDGLYTGVSAVVRLAGGHLADRRQRHRLVAGSGYALSALCKLGLLFAGGSTAALSATLAADRVGKGVRTAPRDAMISLSCAERDLGRAFGVHRAMDTTGALLGPLAAFALLWLAVDAYDVVFLVSFCFGLFGVVLLYAFVPERSSPAVSASRPSTLRAVLRLPAVPAFRRVLVTASLLGLVSVGDGFLYLVLQKRLDLDTVYFPLLPLGSAAVYLLLAVPIGRAADRVGRRIPYLCGHLGLLGVCLVLFSPAPGWPLTVCVLVLLGTYYAATDGVLMALGGPVVPEEQRAAGLALLQSGQAVGRLLASVLFGAAWTLWSMQAALALAAAGLAAGLLLARFLLPAHPRESG